MARDLPRSVVNSLRVLALMVVVSGIITVLTRVLRDDVLRAWAKGNAGAQETLNSGGIEALRESPSAPGFVALAVVAFVGFVLLAIVLGSLLVSGYGWARLVLTATAFAGALVAGICLTNDLPVIFTVLATVLLLLGFALVFFLWRKDTTAHVRHV